MIHGMMDKNVVCCCEACLVAGRQQRVRHVWYMWVCAAQATSMQGYAGEYRVPSVDCVK
jgi:hypothetical protein